MLIYILILLNVCLLVSGQLLFKLGFNRIGAFSLHTMITAFTQPLILGGLVLYVVATLLWFAILSRVQLSIAYPLQSMAYVFGLVASVLVLHEKVTPQNWIGTFVILVGVVLISWQAKL